MKFGRNGGERRIRRECKRRQNWGGFDQNALYTHMKFTNNIKESSRLISVPVAAQNPWLSF